VRGAVVASVRIMGPAWHLISQMLYALAVASL
jgi:hypothetical protein